MNVLFRSVLKFVLLTFFLSAAVPGVSAAQTDGQLLVTAGVYLLADANDDEQQRLNPQSLRPYSNGYEYQQHQQQESNGPMGPGTPPAYQGARPQGMQGQSRAQADALEAARKDWQHRPPLAAEHNPLLGKWMRPASSRGNPSDPFAQLGAMMKGGLCDVLFGGGIFEFRPHTLVGMDAGQPEQEIDQVEYRGNAGRVAVIPKTTVKLMVFDFDGPDRINWAGQHCVLERVGGAAREVRGVGADKAGASNGSTMRINFGMARGPSGFTPIAGHELWVLNESAENILLKVGVKASNYGSVLKIYAQACQYHFPMCAHGMQEIKARSVGVVTTDATGSARLPPLPMRNNDYYLFGEYAIDNGEWLWNVPFRVKAGSNGLTLDQRNATSSN